MKINKMPTTLALSFISWFIVISSIFTITYLFISKGIGQDTLITGFLILWISLILWGVLRMFAIIGQVLFDTKKEIQIIREINNSFLQYLPGLAQGLKAELQNQTAEIDRIIKALNQSLSGDISNFTQGLKSEIRLLGTGLQNLSSSCEQINCDSKDLNQNINQIRNFFEQIERHLDLKK